MNADLAEHLRARARELGFAACHFTTAAPPTSGARFQAWLAAGYQGEMAWLARTAPKRLDLQQVLPGARSVISLAAVYAGEKRPAQRGESPPAVHPLGRPAPPLPPAPVSLPASPAGFISRYARYTDYHAILAEPLKMLTEWINRQGGAGTRSLWHVDTGPLLERDLAQRAGVGFIGKHTNLVSRRLGNWFFLAEILTTLELPPDAPEKNRCGRCARCLAACPTAALVAPFQLDARRCLSYLTIELRGSIPVELRPALGNRIFGCDDCLAVCPWNRFAGPDHWLAPQARPSLATPDLLELLTLDEAGFRRRCAGTPIERTGWRGLRRNVCVALGNVGDLRALPALDRAARETDPLIAEHAWWAREQIQRNRADQKV